ncbi:uncharacterized protein LY79DRAFT_367432 [Colletotrichum navitas]|uniref:Uncharacterized protein n=1 Tax=Colletotrichum navitas TaxID=681940 RepID=A0AAD8PRS4_9PEZI|nr:uncharacterized protein LY79DRAFT_367432 [Colletotrichum navitas]KAK1574489.1 hypothetical protein LY79DRAFT_367432 [Colletotrichum navitas]
MGYRRANIQVREKVAHIRITIPDRQRQSWVRLVLNCISLDCIHLHTLLLLPAVLVSPEFHNGIHDLFSRSGISTRSRSDAHFACPRPPPCLVSPPTRASREDVCSRHPQPVSMKGSRDTQTRRFHLHDVCDFCILMRVNALYAVIESRVKKKNNGKCKSW